MVLKQIMCIIGDTDSIYIEKKFWNDLDKTIWLGEIYYKVKMIMEMEVFFIDLFLAPKVKYCLTINEYVL